MCGILGVFHYAGGQPDPERLSRQRDTMRHRGPDDAGLWVGDGVALAHRRLAIVDLSPAGHQPMADETGSLHVTFNGAIYGFRRMREELIRRGVAYRSATDTELLLHLYRAHGPDLPAHLRGMFAFGLFDEGARRLLLARDRLGVKPLYYHDDGRRIVFASELKALAAEPSVPRAIDPRALVEYLALQYVPAPRTIWAGVRKLPPGHALTCDRDGVRVTRYWRMPEAEETAGAGAAPRDPAEAARELRARLAEAVRLRMDVDVPLGAFLSGGIDSSAVVALMAGAGAGRVRTFSVGFEEEDVSELAHARAVATHLGTEHHELVVRPDALSLLPRLVVGLDEPLADASILPTFHVSAAAAREVKVALTGDGGDEAWGGYRTYPAALRHQARAGLPAPLKQLAGVAASAFPPHHRVARKLRRVPMDVFERHLEAMACFPRAEIPGILHPDLLADARGHDPHAAHREAHGRAARGRGPVHGLLWLDAATYLADDVLFKVDRASMLNSLEVRSPLLDHTLIEFAAGLPLDLKLRAGTTKWLLREAVRDLLPPAILARGKQGFSVPLERWFGGGFGRFAREILLDPRTRRRGWLRGDGIARLVGETAPARGTRAHQVYALLCLELWARACLDDAPAAACA